jgi:hypothetical protein
MPRRTRETVSPPAKIPVKSAFFGLYGGLLFKFTVSWGPVWEFGTIIARYLQCITMEVNDEFRD